MAMAPGPIVKDFNVIEDIGPGQIPGLVDALADALLFQTAEERFGDRAATSLGTAATCNEENNCTKLTPKELNYRAFPWS
jgi:hypothetical protein